MGTVPIPDEYCSGDKIPITVCIRDEWDCEPSATFDLQLTRCRANEVRKSTRGPLLSRRDPVVPDNPLKATPTPVKKDYDEVEHFMEAVSAVTPYLSAMKRSGVGRNNKKRV